MIKYNKRKYMMGLSEQNTWDTKTQYKLMPIDIVMDLSGELSRDVFFSIKNNRGDILESKIKNPKEFIEIKEGEFACVETLKNNVFAHRQITNEASTIINAFKIESYEHTSDNLVWLLHTLENDILYNCDTRKRIIGKFASLSETEEELTVVSKMSIGGLIDTWIIILEKKTLKPLHIYSSILREIFPCEEKESEILSLLETEKNIMQKISSTKIRVKDQAHLSRNKN